ncbi:MAG: hypothetical protein VKP62_12555 [Candidatus Sericytochromatia bacterium]|nr:hypothetical protein [Candidatus Sericytochromatia bacterium]
MREISHKRAAAPVESKAPAQNKAQAPKAEAEPQPQPTFNVDTWVRSQPNPAGDIGGYSGFSSSAPSYGGRR